MDIIIKSEEICFEFRSVGILINNGKILLQREKLGNEYALPGGAVKLGETTESALIREYKEETGTNIKIVHLLWTEENFWNQQGKSHHGLAYYYLIDFCDGNNIAETAEFVPQNDNPDIVLGWVPVSTLKDITVYPTFLKDEINNLNGKLKHFVSKEQPLNLGI